MQTSLFGDLRQVVGRQLVAWRALYESSPLPDLGVQLVAIPGNHEVQDGPASPHFAYRAAEEACGIKA